MTPAYGDCNSLMVVLIKVAISHMLMGDTHNNAVTLDVGSNNAIDEIRPVPARNASLRDSAIADVGIYHRISTTGGAAP